MNRKKWLTILISAIMIISYIPVISFAGEDNDIDLDLDTYNTEEEETAGDEVVKEEIKSSNKGDVVLKETKDGSGSEKTDINDYIIHLSEDILFYNGEVQYPEVIIDGLNEDVDYRVDYPYDSCEAGSYSLYVVGINDFTGEKTLQYKIIKTTIKTISSKELYRNGTYTIDPTVTNPNGNTTFSSNNSEIASVSTSGKITAKKAGSTTIIVKNGFAEKRIKVTVKNPYLNKKSVSLYRTGKSQLKITGKIGKATYKTTNSKVATVSSNGQIKAKKKGKCTINVKSNGITMKCKVTVKNPYLNKKSVSLYRTGKSQLKITGKIGKATYKTTNSKVATVSSKGQIKAKKKGKCTIKVKSNGITMNCKVTVKNPYLNKKSVTIVKGKTSQLKVNGQIGKATYKSTKSSVATVTSKGLIKAKKKGSCTIKVKSNGVTLKCRVVVKNPPPTYVYITRTGKRYHCDYYCWGLRNANALYKVTLTKAKKKGLTKCHVCYY